MSATDAEIQAAIAAVEGGGAPEATHPSEPSEPAAKTRDSPSEPADPPGDAPAEPESGAAPSSESPTEAHESPKTAPAEDGQASPGLQEKFKNWNELLKHQGKLHREREAVKRQRQELEAKIKARQEEDTLRQQDPVAWARRYLPADAYEQWTKGILAEQGYKEEEEKLPRAVVEMRERLKQLEAEKNQLAERWEQEKRQTQAQQYMGQVKELLGSDEFRLASRWPGVEQEISNLVVRWHHERDELLTPRQAVEKIHQAVLTHAAKLREAMDGPATSPEPAASPKRIEGPARPKSLTNDIGPVSLVTDEPDGLTWDQRLDFYAEQLQRASQK